MVIDSSALFAILNREPDRGSFSDAIEGAGSLHMSAVTILECGIVARTQTGDRGVVELDALVRAISPVIVPFDAEQAAIARDAFARFGKGRHRAGLNFGDCAVYALAASLAEPVLCKGGDFAATDLEIVPLG